MPEEPTPAMALPTMNMADDWAAPQSTDPSSKIKKKTRKDHYTVSASAIELRLDTEEEGLP